MNVTDPIRRAAQQTPDSVALIRASGEAITYRALDRQIDRCARRANALGLRPGQIVRMQISGPDEGFALIVALGLGRAGVVTADPALPPEHLNAVVLRPGEKAPGSLRAIPLDWSWLADDGAEPDRPALPDGALFRICTTSGTTGRSRFCPISHATMAARVAATGYPVTQAPWHTILVCALGFDGNWAMRTVLATLGSGGTLVVGERNQERLIEVVLRQNVTTLVTSPISLQTFVAAIPPGIGPLPSLKAVVAGGSQLPEKLWRDTARRLCPNILTSFGAAETSVIAVGGYKERAAIPLAAGRLVAGVAAQAVDDQHRPLPAGAQGALRFRTPGDIDSYFADEEATRATFRDGWFYSGDVGSVTPDGVLVIAGRTSELINRGGVKVSPRSIEDVLLTLPTVTQAAAFAVLDDDGMPRIWAALVADQPLDATTVHRHCQAALGPGSPVSFLQMPDLPRNPNGKVATQRLVALAIQQLRPDPRPPEA